MKSINEGVESNRSEGVTRGTGRRPVVDWNWKVMRRKRRKEQGGKEESFKVGPPRWRQHEIHLSLTC